MATKNKKTSRKLLNKTKNLKGKYLILFALVFGVIGGWLLHATFASVTFSDDFNSYPDGLITSEYTYWNPAAANARKNSNWEMTSGALFSATLNGAKVAYSGYPTYETSIGPSPTITSGNNSAVFRLTSVPSNFGNAEVSFKLFNKQLVSTAGTPAVAWDGIHVFLRYQSEENLYYASINRRDGALAIKKKVPGGTSNGGTYYTLAGTSAGRNPIPFNTWQNVKATIQTNANNTVTIQLFNNGNLLLSYTDNGSVGGPAITNPGKVGIRGDNDEFYIDDFAVNNPDVIDPSDDPPPIPGDTTLPTVSMASPINGATLAGNANLTSTANDNVGVVKVEYYDGLNLIGAATNSPYSFTWDTTKISNGPHTLSAKAYDAAQNPGVSSNVSVTVSNQTTTGDTIAPIVTITSPINGTTISKSVSIKATATDNVKVVKMYVYVDGNLRMSTSNSNVSSVQGIKGTGNHTITVTAVDSAGNVGRSSVNIYKQ